MCGASLINVQWRVLRESQIAGSLLPVGGLWCVDMLC